jgi:hypothetical protein
MSDRACPVDGEALERRVPTAVESAVGADLVAVGALDQAGRADHDDHADRSSNRCWGRPGATGSWVCGRLDVRSLLVPCSIASSCDATDG